MILSEIRTTYYPEVAEEVFWRIVRLDPTYNAERPEKKGHYTSWLLTLYRQGSLREEDYADATEYLTAFEANKRRLEERDIGRYRSLPDLYDAVRPYLAERVVSRKSLKRDEATKVYEDDEWTVVVPHTWEASKLYGAGTRWCTASTSTSSWFNRYTDDGELYININRKNGEKYQMLALRDGNKYCYCYNASDRQVFSGDIGLSRGAVEFYNHHFQFAPQEPYGYRMVRNYFYTQVDIESFGMVKVTDDGCQRVLEGYNFKDFTYVGKNSVRCREAKLGKCLIDFDTLEVVPTKACDFCNDFNGAYAVAWKNAKIGVMDRQGVFHKGPELLKSCVQFCDGIAPTVLHQNTYNFIDEQGNLVFDDNFKWCGSSGDGCWAVMFSNGVRGFVTCERKEFPLPGVTYICEFTGSCAKVSFGGKWNLVRRDGSYVFDQPVKEITSEECVGLYRICLPNGHYTFCDLRTGTPITNLQFPEYRKFSMGLAAVRTDDGRWNYLQTDGTLLLKRGVDWCTDFDRNLWVGKIHTYRGDNYVNTDGELLTPWPKPQKRR